MRESCFRVAVAAALPKCYAPIVVHACQIRSAGVGVAQPRRACQRGGAVLVELYGGVRMMALAFQVLGFGALGC